MSSYSGAGRTVLVVDDSDDVREFVALQLRLSGFNVVEARDGREAVELAMQNCPALILMDLNMPVMDGFSAARQIRSIKELCRVVIVAFSAHGSGGGRERAIEAGCDEYVSKTAGVGRLQAIVTQYLTPA